MKFFCLLIVMLISSQLSAQNDKSRLYNMHIISWSKESGKTKWNAVTIDEQGKVFLNQSETEVTINIDNFNEKLVDFLKSDFFWKHEANDDPPLEITEPNNGFKNLYTNVRLEEDIENDKKFFTPTTYRSTYSNLELDDFDISVFKFLSEDEATSLKELLN